MKRHTCRVVRQCGLGIEPDWIDHPNPRVLLAVLEVEGEGPRLNLDLPGGDENRLEADSLLSDVALRALLGAFAQVADGSDILSREPVLVTLQDQPVGVHAERDTWVAASLPGCFVAVVVRILEKLENKTSRA